MEPQLQHAALRLTARGWETAPLPAPDGSGALVVALDLHTHEAVAEHSGGGVRPLAPSSHPGACAGPPRRLSAVPPPSWPSPHRPASPAGSTPRAATEGR